MTGSDRGTIPIVYSVCEIINIGLDYRLQVIDIIDQCVYERFHHGSIVGLVHHHKSMLRTNALPTVGVEIETMPTTGVELETMMYQSSVWQN
jgi:hypothetical protein